ncbi:MAG: hypothetical protein RIC95_09440 [Vicingaceae bacterium]
METGNKLDRFSPTHQGRKSKYFDYGGHNSKGAIHTLQLELRDGSYLALPYVYLSEVFYEPSIGVILKLGEYKVTIKGRRLDFLFEQLCLYNVSQIRSAVHELADQEPTNQESKNKVSEQSNSQNWVNKVRPDKASSSGVEGLDFVEVIEIENIG